MSIRQIHRWTATVFTVTVMLVILEILLSFAGWLVYVPLPPLAVMFVTGLTMLVRPHLRRTPQSS